MYVPVSQRTTQKKTGYTPVANRTQKTVSRFSLQANDDPLVGFEAPGIAEASSSRVPSTIGMIKGVGQMAKTFARETIRQPASVGVEISSRLDKLLGRPKIEQLKPEDFGPLAGTARFLFGEEALPSLDKRIQAGTEIAQKLGFEGPAAKAASSFFILGITGLDFLPFGGSVDDVVKALRAVNNVEDASKILRTIGVAEDLIPEASIKFAQLTDDKLIKEGLESIAKTQQTTKAKAIPKAYTPVAQRQGFKSAPGEAIVPKVGEYSVIHQGNKIKKVKGEPVKIIDGVDTFLHQDENGNWAVSEATTGRNITGGGFENKNFAIKAARENLDALGETKLKKLISENQLPQTKVSVPKTTSPLTQEARKYKSAEEFVKAQQEVAPLGKKLSSEESSVIASSVDLVKVGRGSNETFPNIEIKFVPENQIRNKGIGDYREIPSGGLEVLVSDKLSLLERQKVAVHELVEATLAKKRGISFEEINKFDREHLDAIQPGELKDAPYRNEHLAANEAENIFSKSQLTDLFNKVKGELPVLPKIKDTGFLKTLEKEITKKISAKAPLIRQATRFEKKIEKINTAKDILDNRRSFIKAVQKQFGVTDNELKQITQRDIRLMNNIEFKNHLDNIRVKVEQLAEKRQALNELESTIQTKELQKTENLQKALKLPTIPNMTTNQLRSFNETLSQFKQGDEFLSVRKLETVDKTDLRGIRTLREAKERLAQELGVDISKLDNIKVEALDRYRYDTALAERNPFYGLMVDTVNTSMLNAEARYLKVEEKINSLINAARKSRPQGIVGKFVPQDKQIFQWLESTDEVKKTLQLTNEELEAAQYIQKQYAEMRDYLVQFGTLKKYRQDYVTHINRGFLEEWRETGLLNAFKNVFKNYRREEAIFNIISDTGQILPLEKFFKFSMRRTGGIEPTQNVANAFLSYLKAFEKKAALDSIVPKLDIYAHSLTPKTLTPRGLEFDRSLKTFVNEWLNTKKGRTAKIVGVEQGGKIDLLLRSGKAFTAMLDLGLNIPIGLSARAGENMTNFINLGAKKYANGLIRARTAQGQKIVKDYKNFIGRTPFSELFDARKGLGDKLIDATFGLFQDATVRSNKTFLLGSMTDEEFKAGRITSERLAELKREMGRYRVVEGAKSVVGSTSVGSVLTQYKSWAIPPLRTTIDNVSKIIKNPQLLKAREGQELLRGTLATLSVVFLVKSFVGDDKDESFIGTLINKTYRDAMTLVGSLDPKTITSEPRLVSFISDLGQALSQIIKLEEYSEASKKAGELKGPVSLERALTPRAIKQFIPKEKKEGSIDGLPELPKLPKLPQLPKLPKF